MAGGSTLRHGHGSFAVRQATSMSAQREDVKRIDIE